MFIQRGILNVANGKIDITDPCYDKNICCRINDVKVEPGHYHCFFIMREGRVAEVAISLSCLLEEYGWEPIGTIGVDAGLAGFFIDKPDYSDDEWQAFCDKLIEEDKINEDSYVYLYDNAFFTESGWGDGSYEVFGIKENDKFRALKIVFIPEDYDDDYE